MNGGADAKRLQQRCSPIAPRAGQLPGGGVLRNGSAACEVVLGDSWRVRPDGKLIDELGAWLAPQNVQLVYGSARANSTMHLDLDRDVPGSAAHADRRARVLAASPNTSTKRSEQPLITFGGSLKPGTAFTMPRTFTTRFTDRGCRARRASPRAARGRSSARAGSLLDGEILADDPGR
jgi:hypothetical protein